MIRSGNRNVNTATVDSFTHQPVASAVFICTLGLCMKAPFHRNRKGAWEILWSHWRSWGPERVGGRVHHYCPSLLPLSLHCHKMPGTVGPGVALTLPARAGLQFLTLIICSLPLPGLEQVWLLCSGLCAHLAMYDPGQNVCQYNFRSWFSTYEQGKKTEEAAEGKSLKEFISRWYFSTSVIWMVFVWMCYRYPPPQKKAPLKKNRGHLHSTCWSWSKFHSQLYNFLNENAIHVAFCFLLFDTKFVLPSSLVRYTKILSPI